MIFLFIYHFLIFQLSHSKQSIPLSGVLFSLVRTHHSPHAPPRFLSNFALVVRDLPRLPTPLRSKARGGEDGTTTGGTEASPTAIRTREAFFYFNSL